jgi:hypothetical protein
MGRRELFTESELAAVAGAVALLHGRTAGEASDLSHREPGWQMVADGDTIPFATAYLDPEQDRTSPHIQARAAQIADDYARRGALHR